MRELVLVAPGDLDTRTGGFIYDRRIVDGLRRLGWRVDVAADFTSVPDAATVLVDGLAWLRADVGRHRARLRVVPLVHLPLALEVGLDAAEATRRDALEWPALADAPLVVATGRVTVDYLAGRGIARDRIALVEPGTDRAPLARGSGGPGVALASVAAVVPGKRHELLLRALAAVPSRGWTLTCAGSLDRDPATASRVRALVAALNLSDRVSLAGELDDAQLRALYDRSDAFVLPTVRETYGMAVAEAIARGLPVVSTTVGAIPSIVGGGGILVGPDDERALASALARLVGDAERRRALARAARAARERLRTWEEASAAMAAALAPVTA